jgi:hypothetical protein
MSERQYLAEENAKLRAEVELLRGCHSGCPCQACGEEFREDVMLPDAMWNEIRPHGKPPGGGLLCGRCIGLLMFGRLQLAQDRFAQLQEAATQADSRADKAEAQLAQVVKEGEGLVAMTYVLLGQIKCDDDFLRAEFHTKKARDKWRAALAAVQPASPEGKP